MKAFFRMLGWGLVLSLVLPLGVGAMAGMYTAKFVDGPNVVIMANNVTDTQADVPVTYNLRVYDLEGKPLYFGNIDVQVRQGKKTMQQYNVRRGQNSDASIALTFPRQGTYMLETRFMDNDKQVARGEFPIVVGKSPNQGWLRTLASWQTVVGFVLGVVVTTVPRLPYTKRLGEKLKKWFARSHSEKAPKRNR